MITCAQQMTTYMEDGSCQPFKVLTNTHSMDRYEVGTLALDGWMSHLVEQ